MAKTMNKYEKIANDWWSSLSINEMKKYQIEANELPLRQYYLLSSLHVLNIYAFVHPEKKAEIREYYINELGFDVEYLNKFPLCYRF